MKRILIIHGWGNHRPLNHWHRNLANQLRRDGNVVAYPQLPNTDNPILEEWLSVISTELDMLREIGTGELVVVGHSLGCLTWLHAVKQKLTVEKVSRVLLVAPADPELCGEVATFQLDLGAENLREQVHQVANSTLIVESDSDPWLPRGAQLTFANELDLPVQLVTGAGHFSLEDHWSQWQGVIDWVNDSTADLTMR